jgi:ribosomal protein L32
VLRHDACGEIADPRLTCAHCGEQITAHNVTLEAGPGFRTEVAAEELA